MDRVVNIYQTDTFAKGLREGIENVDGWNEPFFQSVIPASPRWIKLSGLKHSEYGSWRIARFQLFEEIMALEIFFGLFLVRLQRGIKDAFDVGGGTRGCRFYNRNRSGRLTHDEVIATVWWMADKLIEEWKNASLLSNYKVNLQDAEDRR